MAGWAGETTLDVEWAHVFAPGANILLVETPVSETEGVHGFPQMIKAENYVIKHHLASVISQSFGATENTFKTTKSLLALRSAFKLAAKNHVTVLAASGDTGSTDYKVNARPVPVPGQQLAVERPARDERRRHAAEPRRHGQPPLAGHRLERPQRRRRRRAQPRSSAARATRARSARSSARRRGTPDISLSAAVDGGVWVYSSYAGASSPYHVFGGTSAATPEFAGIVALANQSAGKPLGRLNPLLYSLTGDDGLVDVTTRRQRHRHVPELGRAHAPRGRLLGRARLRPRERARHGRRREARARARRGRRRR